jgi:hypothetical protein
MRSRALSLAVAAVCVPSVLVCQQPPVRAVSATPVMRLGAAPATPGPDAPPKPEAVVAQDPAAKPATPVDPAAAAAATARVQKFKQLQFDRRPSSILQAWSAPELKPYDPAEDKDKQEKAGAAAPVPSAPGESEPSKEEIEAMLLQQFGGGSPVAITRVATGTPGVVIAPVSSASAPAGAPASAPPAGSAPAVPAPGAATPAGTPAGAAPTPPNPADAQVAEKKLQREMEMLQRDVTLGRWEKVREFLASLPDKEKKGCYEHLLKVVLVHPQKPEDQRVPANLQEKNRFAFDDALVLASLAPEGFDKKQVPMLAPIVQRAIEGGSVMEELVRLLGVETAKPEPEQRIDRRESALLLATIGQDIEIGPFLPTVADAEKANDREGLNLLARHALAMFAKEKRNVHLETAWQVTQAALAKGEIGDDEKKEALRRAVELAPKVKEELGPAWLADSFTSRPERGMEIIATIGGQVAKGFQEKAQDTTYRSNGLRLQKTAVEALLKVAPQLAEQWKPTLGLLAASPRSNAHWGLVWGPAA